MTNAASQSSVLVKDRPATRSSVNTPTVISVVSPIPNIRSREFPSWKAVLDYTLAPIIFLLGLPVLLIAMLLVKVTSSGPMIYTQQRVGRGGRVFTIYKVRTMYDNCEKETGPQWSTGKADLRITPIGRILRTLHIDELPQLINVLRGDMSLIGPRPERPEIVADLRLSVYNYDFRHQVKPGLTGFAQVHLPPDSNILTVRNKLIYDRYYLSRFSLWLDLKILVCTAFKVVGLKKLYCRPPRQMACPEATSAETTA
jgi:lipopolysaccharide/colanic/teichoic acid biosynthesis glycosyltransferase